MTNRIKTMSIEEFKAYASKIAGDVDTRDAVINGQRYSCNDLDYLATWMSAPEYRVSK